MIKIGKALLLPSDIRDPVYIGLAPKDNFFTFVCLSCGSQVITPIILLWNLQSNLSNEIVNQIKSQFGIGFVGKTRDGGWPAIQKVACPNCAHQYAVLAGVKEPSNGFFEITVQGVCEIFL